MRDSSAGDVFVMPRNGFKSPLFSRVERLALVLSLRVPLQSWCRLWECCRGGLSLQTVTQLDQACLLREHGARLRAVESNDDQDHRHHQHRQRSGAKRTVASVQPIAESCERQTRQGENTEKPENRAGEAILSGSKALGVHVNDLIQCLKH